MERRLALLPVLLLVCVPIAAAPPQTPTESPLTRVALVALAPAEQQAVLRLPDGKLELLRPGDAVPETQATVVEVLAKRLVLEERLERGVRWVWMEPARGPKRPARLRFLDPRPPSNPPPPRPDKSLLNPKTEAPDSGRGPGG